MAPARNEKTFENPEDIVDNLMQEAQAIHALAPRFSVVGGLNAGHPDYKDNKAMREEFVGTARALIMNLWRLEGSRDPSKADILDSMALNFLQTAEGPILLDRIYKDCLKNDRDAVGRQFSEMYREIKRRAHVETEAKNYGVKGAVSTEVRQTVRAEVGASLPPEIQRQLGLRQATPEQFLERDATRQFGGNTRRTSVHDRNSGRREDDRVA